MRLKNEYRYLLNTVSDLFMDLSKVKPRFGVEKQSTSDYQITDQEVLAKIFRGKKSGRKFNHIVLILKLYVLVTTKMYIMKGKVVHVLIKLNQMLKTFLLL